MMEGKTPVRIFQELLSIARRYLENSDKRVSIALGMNGDVEFIKRLHSKLDDVLASGKLEIILYSNELQEGSLEDLRGFVAKNVDGGAVSMLRDALSGKCQGVVRGRFPSSGFLSALKDMTGLGSFHRVALMETAHGHEFLFAPVGIDEGSNQEDRFLLASLGIRLLERLGMAPVVYLLSGGRLGDVDRDPVVKRSMEETISVVTRLQSRHPGAVVRHGEILIEKAVQENANFIMAPDGISGNLIYRTLVHLGKGLARGAFYLDPELPFPIIDTSRVGSVIEYEGAVLLAIAALASAKHHG